MTTLPKYLTGGCAAGEWHLMAVKDLVNATKSSGCNCLGVLEAMAPCYTKDGYDLTVTIEKVYQTLCTYLDAAADAGLWVVLHLANANDETLDKSKEYPVVYGLEKCKWLVNQLAQKYTKNVILCPVAEEGGKPNEAAFIRHCVDVWHNQNGGLLATTGSGRVGSASPDFAVIDYHTQSLNDFGPQAGANQIVLLDSDNSPMINALRAGAPAGCYSNPITVSNWGIKAASLGKSTNFYFGEKVIDVHALAALGKAYKGKVEKAKKPNWLDKLVAWFTKLFGKK